MRNDRRWFPRFAVRSGVIANLETGGNKLQGSTVDISCTGAYISDVQVNQMKGHNAKVVFEVHERNPNSTIQVTRSCQILPGRTGQSGGCAIRFDIPLTGKEVASLAKPDHLYGSLELARDDYTLISDEISGIQSCRNYLFIGSLSAISAWVITAIGIGITNKLDFSVWAALGASFPYILLSVSILALIEKANACHLRRGFLAALTDYLRNGAAPPNYIGWAQLKLNRSECRSRLANKLCPSENHACWENAVNEASRLTKQHHLISNILDSYNAFISFVYSVFYALSSLLILVVAHLYLSTLNNIWITGSIDISIGITITLMGVFLYKQIYCLRRGKKSGSSG